MFYKPHLQVATAVVMLAHSCSVSLFLTQPMEESVVHCSLRLVSPL